MTPSLRAALTDCEGERTSIPILERESCRATMVSGTLPEARDRNQRLSAGLPHLRLQPCFLTWFRIGLPRHVPMVSSFMSF